MRALATVAILGAMFGGMATAGAQTAAAPTAAAPAQMSEGRARMLMMEACGNVSNLSRDGQGNWHGSCSKGNMMVNAEGNVVAAKNDAGWITESHARSLANNACGNVSALRMDENNTWVGMCSKGTVMVEQSGKVTTK